MGWNPCPVVGGKDPAQLLVQNEIYCATKGGFEIPITPETHTVKVLAKPGIAPWKGQIEILPGQLAVRIPFAKASAPPLGWYAVDLRTHCLSPKAALLEAEASGINLVQILASSHWPECFPKGEIDYAQLLEFSGTQAAGETSLSSIMVNTLNRHPVLGSVSLLHSHRPVYPWFSGWEKEDTPWSIQDWCKQCHRIKGVVIWPELDPLLPEYEAIAGIVNGEIDCIELCDSLGSTVNNPESRLPWLYSLWTKGIACGIVGSSGKCNNQKRIGTSFTWIHVRGSTKQFDGIPINEIMASVKTGNGSASIGPLLALNQGPECAQAFVDLIEPDTIFQWINESGVVGTKVLEPGCAQTITWEATLIKNWLSCRLVDNFGNLIAHSPMIKGPDFGRTAEKDPNPILQNALSQGLVWSLENNPYKNSSLQNQLTNYLQKALDLLECIPSNRKL